MMKICRSLLFISQKIKNVLFTLEKKDSVC